MPEYHGRRVIGLSRIGKRIVFGLEGDLFLVLHLMIAGRLQWKERGIAVPRKVGLAAFDLDTGSLLLTEASSHKRASLHVVRGSSALAEHDPGGIEILETGLDDFQNALVAENHTLKRALTDPARPCSASSIAATRPTTAPGARLTAGCWPIEASRGC